MLLGVVFPLNGGATLGIEPAVESHNRLSTSFDIASWSRAQAAELVAKERRSNSTAAGGERERTYYALGPGDTWAQAVRVRAIKPRGKQVELATVAEDPRVHVN